MIRIYTVKNRRPLTPEQIAKRSAKAKATREANKKKALKELGLPTNRKKVRKKRAPMSEEQKAAAVKRLAKARKAKGPSQNKLIAEEVRLLPDDNPLSLTNVRSWIKENRDQLKSMRPNKDSKDAKIRAQYQQIETYVANLEAYLRTGTYTDNRYGMHGQNKILYRVTTMAYHRDGTPKRSVGFMYPDIGLYTKEMLENDKK